MLIILRGMVVCHTAHIFSKFVTNCEKGVDTKRILWYNIVVTQIGVSPSGKARDFDSLIRKFESCYPCQKIRCESIGFFICAADTTSFARKGNIISSEARTSLPLAAQMNEVEALPQMMLQQVANDVGFAQWSCASRKRNEIVCTFSASKVFQNFVDTFRLFRVCRQIRTGETVEIFTTLRLLKMKSICVII